MDAIKEINDINLTTTVQPGINGMILERSLNQSGYTLGHIPQSLYCSSLGGWIACRAAGQFSTKYGKIEDIILALEAVLPNGTIITSKPLPRTATGPSVEHLLIGAEGRLGIVTQATLKIWPIPETRAHESFLFRNLTDALEAVRHIMRKNVYPAVIRIYDQNETLRHFYKFPEVKDHCMLILLMEGAQELVSVEQNTAQKSCTQHHGKSLGEEPVHQWLNTRFNVKESSDYTPRGFIFDTVEMTVNWSHALALYNAEIAAMRAIKGVVVASAHASHFYPQGICFYFTFGGLPPKKIDPFEFYQSIWDTMMDTCLHHHGSISHHHGIGILRGQWLKKELDNRMQLFTQIQHLLDPQHIMNPGKMGVTP
jgi:alkyldihydroxyacetonephosphate synthase